MKQIHTIFFVSIWLLITHSILADPILTFFFRNYPEVGLAQRTLEKLHRPHGIAKQHLQALMNPNPIGGIFTTYFGFLDASSKNGQIRFPRKKSNASFQLVITNKITPISMFKTTISHWELEPGTPAAVYNLELKEDENTKLSFWQMEAAPTPENNRLDATRSIVIIAKPHNIFVPTGVTLTKPSANLLLPDIYVKKGINSIRNSLYMLNLGLFFRPIDLLYKKEKTKYEVLIKE